MPGDEMAAESLLQSHGLLEIDHTADFELIQIRPPERFRRDIDRERFLGLFNDGQAGAVDGDACAERHGANGEIGLHRQYRRTSQKAQVVDHADIFDQSGKHESVCNYIFSKRLSTMKFSVSIAACTEDGTSDLE